MELNPLCVPYRIPPPPFHVFTLPFIKDASVFSVSFEQPTDPKLLSLMTQAVTWHFMHIVDLYWSFVIYVWLPCSSLCIIIYSFIHSSCLIFRWEATKCIKMKFYPHNSFTHLVAGVWQISHNTIDWQCHINTCEETKPGVITTIFRVYTVYSGIHLKL